MFRAVARVARRAGQPVSHARRALSTAEAHGLVEQAPARPSRVRAVFFGFLAGMSTTSFTGWYWLQDEIHAATTELKDGASEVHHEISKISSWMSRMDALTSEVERLKNEGVRRDELRAMHEAMKDERAWLETQLGQHKAQVLEAQKDMIIAVERATTSQ
mmetsp:Transcript_31939/g.83705  ORF Transcript_31939/g.83705 Transcript_31939/m.83705 type:complete len:160 (-) Transcript_31939:206-685(-)|eukprot:CAMPEP_0182916442 /NCGR_PEP_ID=MMETSP0105_2-20130417/943_1 /TAXON_ID=81532 ORGANISM="Acanthoeca-like sp., Strain 10tr" /NCGR_SAMPLE_ID=MMETSP0105_2 /ASSEMBLY_ACC=CAM_ASM_000205 /LENGTH=159 /DNA_ID=CAMNT_0025053393 /DNA_START=33 /DNA_END=512 /DNA_ORIENTATION=+